MNAHRTTLPNALEAHVAHVRQRRAERAVIVTGAVGVVMAAFALWYPAPDGPSVIVPLQPIVIPSPSPAAATHTSIAPIDLEPIEVIATLPTVALAHDDTSTDFAAAAQAHIDAGELTEGLVALRKHLFSAKPSGEMLLQIARVAMQLESYALAEQALLDAGAVDPTNAEIALERGRVLLQIGELGEARTAARLAIRLDRESARAWNLAGRVALASSEWDRAETAFRQAVQRDPTDAMLHNNLGLLYIHSKKAELAIDALETSRELSGDETPAFVHNNLGLAYELASRWEEAREAFEDALTLNPEYARAGLNLRRVIAEETKVLDREEAETATADAADL